MVYVAVCGCYVMGLLIGDCLALLVVICNLHRFVSLFGGD